MKIRGLRQRIKNRTAALVGQFGKPDKYNAPWSYSANPSMSDPIYFINGGDVRAENGRVIKGRLKPKYRKWKSWNWYHED